MNDALRNWLELFHELALTARFEDIS